MEVNIEGELMTDPAIVLDRWKTLFTKLYQGEEPENDNPLNRAETIDPMSVPDMVENLDDVELCNAPVSNEEVKRSVENSKVKKAVGFDQIANELLKHETVIDLLTKLFNLC